MYIGFVFVIYIFRKNATLKMAAQGDWNMYKVHNDYNVTN